MATTSSLINTRAVLVKMIFVKSWLSCWLQIAYRRTRSEALLKQAWQSAKIG